MLYSPHFTFHWKLIVNSYKQYNNNHSRVVYAKMTTYGAQLHLACTGILLISLGMFVSYFRVKMLLRRHSKVKKNMGVVWGVEMAFRLLHARYSLPE